MGTCDGFELLHTKRYIQALDESADDSVSPHTCASS